MNLTIIKNAMTSKILPIVFLLVILLSPVNVFALTETTEDETTTTVTPSTGTTKTPKDVVKGNKEAVKDRIKAAKEEFKTKLAAIKDERKKALVENIDSKIETINERRTTHLGEYLEKLTGVIDRISIKETTLKEDGKDTTKLLSNILAAKTAIAKAQAAVNSQAAKTYTANVTTDELLKNAVGATISQFRTDLKAVFELVKSARAAVLAASLEAKSLSVAKSDSTGTATPSVSPTSGL